MTRIRKLFLVILFVTVVPVMADIPAAFVDIGYGARPMGMGGAYTGLCDDVNAIFWNPAGLTLLRNSQLTVMYTKQFGLIPYGLGAYATQFNQHHMAVGFISSGNDVLSETSFISSYATVVNIPGIGRTGMGMNIRYRHSSYGNNADGGDDRIQGDADGYGIDLGMMWMLDQKTRLGLFYRDMVNNITYNNTTLNTSYGESVPSGLIIGFSRKITTQSTLALDWERALYDDVYDKIHVGAEVVLFRVIQCRGGMWQNMDAETNRNYTLGMGLNVATRSVGIGFDFAYIFNDLAHTPRVSLSLTH